MALTERQQQVLGALVELGGFATTKEIARADAKARGEYAREGVTANTLERLESAGRVKSISEYRHFVDYWIVTPYTDESIAAHIKTFESCAFDAHMVACSAAQKSVENAKALYAALANNDPTEADDCLRALQVGTQEARIAMRAVSDVRHAVRALKKMIGNKQI